MKKRIISLCLLCFSIWGGAQNFDKLMMEQREPLCSEVSNKASKIFTHYMIENKLDSALQILTYWQGKCGETEPVFRAQTLLDLLMGTFNESEMTSDAFDHFFNYMRRQRIKPEQFAIGQQRESSSLGYIPIGQEFDKYTYQLAQQLKGRYPEGTTEFLLVEFYNNNTELLFDKLQTQEYASNYLSQLYMNIVNYYKKMTDYNMAFITGVWVPTGALSAMGVHPDVGYQLGWKKGRMNYDFTLLIRFLNTPTPYWALRNDIKEQTSHFFGGYIGFEVGYDLYAHGRNELQLTSGIAGDGFDMLTANKNKGLESESNFNFNFNLGLGYRYFITQNTYLGLKAKYHLVDYTSNHNFFFKGNPITVHASIGILINGRKEGALNSLQYKLRR